MRIFSAMCLDNETGFQMIASECSFNDACCYLSKSTGERCLSTKKEREHYLFEFSKRSFIYDEKRGDLLGIR